MERDLKITLTGRMHSLRTTYLKIDNRILSLTFTVQYSAAILQQNLCKTMQKYAIL
jgi:hypothetical protein